jgi:hypothetical protein
MKAITLILAMVPSLLYADTVWTFPFDELGAEWNLESGWNMSGTGFYTGSTGIENGAKWIYCNATSGWMTIPAGYDSVTVEMSCGYDYYGYAMDGGSEVSIKGLAYTITDASYFLVDIDDGVVTYGYQSYSASDTTLISQTLPVGAGDQLSLDFTAGRNSYGYIHYVTLYWGLWDLTMIGHGDTGLARSSWGELKTLF